MKIYRLCRKQLLPVTATEAWQFFSDPRNLRLITPAWLDFKMTSVVPDKIYAGLIVTYRIRPLWHISREWVTEITRVREPYFFVDEQRFGPYRFWHHQHQFREIESGVEMEDIVHYILPFDAFGSIIHALSIRRKLNEIFDFRKQALEQIFVKPAMANQYN